MKNVNENWMNNFFHQVLNELSEYSDTHEFVDLGNNLIAKDLKINGYTQEGLNEILRTIMEEVKKEIESKPKKEPITFHKDYLTKSRIVNCDTAASTISDEPSNDNIDWIDEEMKNLQDGIEMSSRHLEDRSERNLNNAVKLIMDEIDYLKGCKQTLIRENQTLNKELISKSNSPILNFEISKLKGRIKELETDKEDLMQTINVLKTNNYIQESHETSYLVAKEVEKTAYLAMLLKNIYHAFSQCEYDDTGVLEYLESNRQYFM